MDQTKVSFTTFVSKRRLIGSLSLLLSTLIFSGCSTLDRSGASGYFQKNSADSSPTASSERQDFEREAAQNELGASSSQRAVAYRQLLRRQEKMLEGKSEREQYYKSKPLLKNDSERLQFLQLNSTAERDRFLNSRGINGDQITHPPEVQNLIEKNDLAAGMTRQAVKESWGPPDDIEVAGNPMYGNEKWQYSEQVTSREGYMTERRTIYFESGRVVGWETK